MEMDKCVICGKKTAYSMDTHIDQRRGYVEGVGQLCQSCYTGNKDTSDICIPDSMVITTPNDQELGGKIRSIFWSKKTDKIF